MSKRSTCRSQMRFQLRHAPLQHERARVRTWDLLIDLKRFRFSWKKNRGSKDPGIWHRGPPP